MRSSLSFWPHMPCCAVELLELLALGCALRLRPRLYLHPYSPSHPHPLPPPVHVASPCSHAAMPSAFGTPKCCG